MFKPAESHSPRDSCYVVAVSFRKRVNYLHIGLPYCRSTTLNDCVSRARGYGAFRGVKTLSSQSSLMLFWQVLPFLLSLSSTSVQTKQRHFTGLYFVAFAIILSTFCFVCTFQLTFPVMIPLQTSVSLR